MSAINPNLEVSIIKRFIFPDGNPGPTTMMYSIGGGPKAPRFAWYAIDLTMDEDVGVTIKDDNFGETTMSEPKDGFIHLYTSRLIPVVDKDVAPAKRSCSPALVGAILSECCDMPLGFKATILKVRKAGASMSTGLSERVDFTKHVLSQLEHQADIKDMLNNFNIERVVGPTLEAVIDEELRGHIEERILLSDMCNVLCQAAMGARFVTSTEAENTCLLRVMEECGVRETYWLMDKITKAGVVESLPRTVMCELGQHLTDIQREGTCQRCQAFSALYGKADWNPNGVVVVKNHHDVAAASVAAYCRSYYQMAIDLTAWRDVILEKQFIPAPMNPFYGLSAINQ